MRNPPMTWSASPRPKLSPGRLADTVASASGWSVTDATAAAPMTAGPSGGVADAAFRPVAVRTRITGRARRAGRSLRRAAARYMMRSFHPNLPSSRRHDV